MKENKILKMIVLILAMFVTLITVGLSPCNAEEPIKIGFIQPLTGPVALYGEKAYYGLTLAFDDVGWSIHGRKIEVIKC